MDQADLMLSGPAADVLRLLRQHGPQSVKSLGTELGVTENAVREQLQRLQAAGLINIDKVRRGTGRPAHLYSLSDKGHHLFPQRHDILLKLLLEQIAAEDGAERAQQLLRAVGTRMADEFVGTESIAEPRDQLDKVVATLAQRGMPIAVVEHEEMLTLHEWSCPFHTLARENAGICEMERQMLERALGTQVTLAERMLDGFVGCKFVIEKARRDSPSGVVRNNVNPPN